MAQQVKNLTAMQEIQEMQIQSLDWEDPLEEEISTHSRILAWRIPMFLQFECVTERVCMGSGCLLPINRPG